MLWKEKEKQDLLFLLQMTVRNATDLRQFSSLEPDVGCQLKVFLHVRREMSLRHETKEKL